MRFFIPLLMAISLTLTWQGAVFADNHTSSKAEATAEATADKAKDQADSAKTKDKEEEECE